MSPTLRVVRDSTRPRQGATMKRSKVIVSALLVMCLCDVLGAAASIESGANPNAKRQQRQPQPMRQSPALEHGEGDVAWVEPMLRGQQWDAIPPTSDYWRDNEATAPAVQQQQQQQQQQVGGAEEEEDGVQQLNWHEAQLARLHGLGPAEIAALSTWQHKLRLHPLPNRLATWHHQSPSFSRPLYGATKASSQQVLTPFDHVDTKGARPNATLTRDDDASDNLLLMPLWPKRSPDNKKSDRDNNRNRNAANRKDKSDAKGGKGAKASRKQQQQQQQEAQQHRDGVVQHEHGGRQGGSSPTSDVNRINRNLATQFLLRSPRENRQYDVPIIECPPAEDGMERFACPTPDIVGRYRCIDDHVLCDGFIDCPGGEDEDGQACMFYKTMKAHLDLVADALLRWVRGR